MNSSGYSNLHITLTEDDSHCSYCLKCLIKEKQLSQGKLYFKNTVWPIVCGSELTVLGYKCDCHCLCLPSKWPKLGKVTEFCVYGM